MTHVIIRTDSQRRRGIGEKSAQYHLEDRKRDDFIFSMIMSEENVMLGGAPGSKVDLVVLTIKDERLKR